MKISVFGMGYVGCVSAACFAEQGHDVIGVDINESKIEFINSGKSPVIEEGMDELIARVVENGKLIATMDTKKAVNESEITLITVGTPSKENGDLDLTYVERVAAKIGSLLANKDGFHIVALRSTVLPGTTEDFLIPVLEQNSGKKVYVDFDVYYNPEFLREGSSIEDFYNPPFTVVGTHDPSASSKLDELYGFIDAPFFKCSIKAAEMLKYVNNSFHGLKVAFANEIGIICKRLGIDSHEVMDLFCKDSRLNLSSYYLKPGFAFGGACLPKDIRALKYKSKMLDCESMIINSILRSNDNQIDEALRMIFASGKKKVGLLGLAFKSSTDDLRESPLVTLAETLIGKGYELKIYDKNVSLAKLTGANKAYIEKEIPHIESLLATSVDEVFNFSDVIVIGSKDPDIEYIATMDTDKVVIDLVRIVGDLSEAGGNYRGLCW
ncbi:MAG: nucleotide sugar dehydrogenase [candidate division Zixibacteria bacterium]|nr:nucleotide sugar dehydrogenase [candidate division Zixibacteria bacterium]NIR66461.1 nucleotide sugar dehydrogenase [candidate division Zixibacteria bacterium]NIS18158.1 nucleotide sugar dehydrogenase [candidate division Zixibacteria bacterium]NIS48049.1 nucleotide sugar dehydrogenase [candidate division Zixibacteria bacterium]NIT54431.1 nucleotide sugar dehydrogenase [candidate division Zixibacteria bacterium]